MFIDDSHGYGFKLDFGFILSGFSHGNEYNVFG